MTDTTKAANMEPFDLNAELMILGSGTSEGVPRLSCLTGGVTCEVCHAARFTPDTIHRRRNTSAIIAFNTKKTKVRRFMSAFIRSLNSVLLQRFLKLINHEIRVRLDVE